MIRHRWLWMLILVGGLARPVSAAEPTLVVETQPVGKLLDTLVAARNRLRPPGTPQPPVAEKQILHDMIGTDELSGLNRDRPIGLIAELDADPSKTRILVMLPVTDAGKFRDLLGRLGIRPIKDQTKDGVEAFGVPFFATPFFVRFRDGYAYGTNSDVAALDPKRLPPAAAVFDAKETSAITARLRLDRVPEYYRKVFLKAAEDEVRQSWAPPGAPPEAEAVAAAGTSLVNRYGRPALTDGCGAVLHLNLDPKTVDVAADLRIGAKPGTRLAKDISAYSAPTNRFAGIVGPDTVGSILVRAPLFTPELRTAAGKILDAAAEMAGNPPAATLPAELISALRRSVNADELIFGAAIRGPDNVGLFTAVAGLTLADTGALENAVRAAVADPRQAPNVFKLDAEKVGSISVHHVNLLAIVQPPDAGAIRKVFGDGPVRFAFAPDALVSAIGPDGLTRLTEALSMKPQPAPIVEMAVSLKRALQVLAKFDPNAEKVASKFFGDMDRVTVLRLSAEGGSALTIKLSLNALVLPKAMAAQPSPPAARPGP